MAVMSSQFAGNDTVLQQPDIALYRGEQQLGTGQLIVGESCLQWESNDKSYSVSLEYPNIPIHGISNDTSSFPHKCVYLLHSVTAVREGEGGEEFDDDDGDEELVELRLVPSDASQLESIYSAISECQLLYPDPEDSDSEEEEEEMVEEESGVHLSEGDGFFTSEEGLQQLTDEGRAALQHLESVFHVTSTSQFTDMMESHDNGHNNDQFEDAD